MLEIPEKTLGIFCFKGDRLACEKEHCKETKSEILILKLERDGERENNTKITFLKKILRRTELQLSGGLRHRFVLRAGNE